MYKCDNWFIYALIDPRDHQVRYVGFTGTTIQKRLSRHMAQARNLRFQTYRDRWLRVLMNLGLTPDTAILEQGTGPSWIAAEQHWIAHFRQAGARLTNLSIGGEGANGIVRSPETREKIRQTMKGRKPPPLAAIRTREVLLGKAMPQETRDKIAASHRGVKFTLERCKNMRAAREKKLSDQDIRDIRRNIEGFSQSVLGRKYNVTQGMVSRIQNRKAAKSVED